MDNTLPLNAYVWTEGWRDWHRLREYQEIWDAVNEKTVDQ